MENKNTLIIPDKKRLAILNGLFYSLTSAIFLCLMIKYKYYLDTFLLGIAMLMGYIVFGARLVLIGGKGYVIDVNGLTVIWFRKWKRFYRWDEFLTARKYMVSAPQVNREAVAEYGGELSTNVCSLIPVRSNRRGEISQAWVLRHPFKVYVFAFATVYKGNIIKNLIMDCQSYTKYRPNETTGGIFVSWRRKEELPTGA